MGKKKISYEEAINEIEQIISKIEREELNLDDLSTKVKRVTELIKYCKDKLRKTEEEVSQILDNMED